MDDDGSKSLDLQEFLKGLDTYGVTLSRDETQQIFGLLDEDRSGTIDFNEFLESLRVGIFNITTKCVHYAVTIKYMVYLLLSN